MSATPPKTPRNARAQLLAEYRDRIAVAQVYDVAIVSPLELAPKLSARLGNRILLKREDLQSVRSFKLRGAYNKIARLTTEQRARGVICASAGNHAQGVALAAQRLGITAWIVMPRTTPSVKVEAVRALGGKTVLHGDAFDDAAAHAAALAEEKGLTMIPPYDDADVIAGQGTVAKEILPQIDALHDRRLDAVFVCTGGGGLLAGVGAWIKAVRPDVKVISVEPEDSDCMAQALAADRRVKLAQVGLFADGVAVRQAGAEPFRVCREVVDECLRVDVDEICAAIRDVFAESRALPEPAGALAVAGVKKWVAQTGAKDQTYVAIISGANLNFDRLRHIAERADRAETLLAVTIPEQPGSFKRFLKQLGRRPITEFNYRYASAKAAHVFAGVHFDDAAAHDSAIAALRDDGYTVTDMTGNEMAKSHIRYMVGGRAPGLENERLYRFEFPERPGACLDFLSAVGSRWNISLFHYRNHGAAYGRVLCGLQVPKRERAECRRALDALGYPYWDETENPVYQLFLGVDD